MRVGLFTDTYFPQVSGVATSIRTVSYTHLDVYKRQRQVQAVSRDMMALAAVKAVSQNASMISLFNSVAKSLDTTMTVSYTHLDVYKRQMLQKVQNSTRKL